MIAVGVAVAASAGVTQARTVHASRRTGRHHRCRRGPERRDPMATNENSDIGAAQGAMLMDQARELCRPILQTAVTTLSPPLCRMAGYHFGWWDAAGNATGDRHGKALRSALTL